MNMKALYRATLRNPFLQPFWPSEGLLYSHMCRSLVKVSNNVNRSPVSPLVAEI